MEISHANFHHIFDCKFHGISIKYGYVDNKYFETTKTEVETPENKKKSIILLIVLLC